MLQVKPQEVKRNGSLAWGLTEDDLDVISAALGSTSAHSRSVACNHLINTVIDPDHLLDDLSSHKAQSKRQAKQ